MNKSYFNICIRTAAAYLARVVVLGWSIASVQSHPLELITPVEYQVSQRNEENQGVILVEGKLDLSVPFDEVIHLEARLSDSHQRSAGAWREIMTLCSGSETFAFEITAPAGGWYQLEVRALELGDTVASAVVNQIGVGEIFVITGQSNSANHGEVRTAPVSDRVVHFHNGVWAPAKDPQPGASGSSGSFIPAFGDRLVKVLNVPIGIVSTGMGATSVREWLPKGTVFPNPPTLERFVNQLDSGDWESSGVLYQRMIQRMKAMGSHGFRAALWHQGESDANQRDQSRTLPGRLYTEYMNLLIGESRREIRWAAPWLVAQASYHTPDDTGSEDIRRAQARVWETFNVYPGPDTDELTGEFRDNNGQGVHFSAKGLKRHGELWAESVLEAFEFPGEIQQEKFAIAAYLPEYRMSGLSIEKIQGATELIYFGIEPTQDGRLSAESIPVEHLKQLRNYQEKEDVRILLTVGGWGRSEHFPTVAGQSDLREVWIKSLKQFCIEHGFSGVDYDWEHPKNAKEIEGFGRLVEATRKQFDSQGLTVSVAQAAWQDLGQVVYENVHHIHLMAYDHGFPHATLEKTFEDVNRVLDFGCPPEKLILGIPFYGRDKDRNARTYVDLISKRAFDPSLDLVDGFAFNSIQTVQLKVHFAKEKKLGGVMVWEVGQDSEDPERSLWKALIQASEQD